MALLATNCPRGGRDLSLDRVGDRALGEHELVAPALVTLDARLRRGAHRLGYVITPEEL
jgi:hypothetical protein